MIAIFPVSSKTSIPPTPLAFITMTRHTSLHPVVPTSLQRSPGFIDHLETTFRHDPTSVPVDQEPEEWVSQLMTSFGKDQAHESVITIGLIILIGNQADEITGFH